MNKAFVILLSLLVARTVAQPATNCTPNSSPKLRFVAQLSVNGCALFVHDTGAIDGPHLAVEPLMCVTRNSLDNVLPRFDGVTQEMYVSVTVLLKNDTVLAKVRRGLSHLAPKSVSFATVTNIRVFTDATSRRIYATALFWDSGDQNFSLRLACKGPRLLCYLRLLKPKLLPKAIVSVWLLSNNTKHRLSYEVQVQNQTFFHQQFLTQRYTLPECNLRFVRSIPVGNCTVRVHQRMDMKGHFLMEPLLCHNMSSLSSESVLHDYSRDMHYLKLDLILQDEAAADAVRTQLADLEPRSVKFMRLWRARSEVSDALRARFEVGELLVSRNGMTAHINVFCRDISGCRNLIVSLRSHPVDFWRHVLWSLTSQASSSCLLIPGSQKRYAWRMNDSPVGFLRSSLLDVRLSLRDLLPSVDAEFIHGLSDGRQFVMIQQRITGHVSFQRNWSEYVDGFGNGTDFWMGLRWIHQLTGATPRLLRVEAVTWSNILYVAEYSSFSVAGEISQYTMDYSDYLRDRSNTTSDSLSTHKRMKFSTKDRDNDQCSSCHCSLIQGSHGGWWFNFCETSNPNGIYDSSGNSGDNYMHWEGVGNTFALQSIRLMLQLVG